MPETDAQATPNPNPGPDRRRRWGAARGWAAYTAMVAIAAAGYALLFWAADGLLGD